MSWIQPHLRGWQVHLKISAGAKKTEIMGFLENRLKMRLHAPAVEGKANKELLRFWQKNLGIRLVNLEILSGEYQSLKTLLIQDAPLEQILSLVANTLNLPVETLLNNLKSKSS